VEDCALGPATHVAARSACESFEFEVEKERCAVKEAEKERCGVKNTRGRVSPFQVLGRFQVKPPEAAPGRRQHHSRPVHLDRKPCGTCQMQLLRCRRHWHGPLASVEDAPPWAGGPQALVPQGYAAAETTRIDAMHKQAGRCMVRIKSADLLRCAPIPTVEL
jgi:hypothetical protein